MSYLSQHEVAVFVGAKLNPKHSANVIGDDESGLLVLQLVSVLQLQDSDLLIHFVVLRNLQFI